MKVVTITTKRELSVAQQDALISLLSTDSNRLKIEVKDLKATFIWEHELTDVADALMVVYDVMSQLKGKCKSMDIMDTGDHVNIDDHVGTGKLYPLEYMSTEEGKAS